MDVHDKVTNDIHEKVLSEHRRKLNRPCTQSSDNYNSDLINPLITSDKCTHHATLASCYQLAQFIWNICASKKGGIKGGGWLCTWRLSWLAVERSWLGHFSSFSTNGHRNCFPAFVRAAFWGLYAVFNQEKCLLVGKVLKIEISLMSGCSQGRKPQENSLGQVSSQQKRKYGITQCLQKYF